MRHMFKVGESECEVLFRALDRPDDVAKLLSLELTGAWVNEAREINKGIIDMLQTRVGRYPSFRDGGASWFGIIMDTNSPDDMSWWYRTFEEMRPDGWKQFVQPGGVSAHAENIPNLPPDYYKRIMQGKDQAWIDVYVHGHYGFILDGKPIYPEFNDTIHVSKEPLKAIDKLSLCFDFGLTPAAVVLQEVNGQYQAIDEIVTEDMGAKRFASVVNQKMQTDYRGHEIEHITGDPAGEQRAQTDETTPFQILHSEGINAVPAYTNDFTIRRESVASSLGRLTMAGHPGLLISPKCKYLRRGMAGGYKYRQLQVRGEERYNEQPEKNIYSHVCEALQYGMLGYGEGHKLLESIDDDDIDLDYSDLDRMYG